MKVLVTCGPTWMPIDDVRVISNVSSGEMGHLIAQEFKKNGAQVTVIEGPVTRVLTDKKIKIIKYSFFDEVASALKKELGKKYDIVVHAAAVSDFRVKGVTKNKISSDKALTLNLIPTQKLIEVIKRLSPKSFLVGFKLEPVLNSKNILKSVQSLFVSAQCDLVVANTLAGGYKGFMVDAAGKELTKTDSKQLLAKNLTTVSLRGAK